MRQVVLYFTAATLFFLSSSVLATGGIHCAKKDHKLPSLSLSWGVGHVIGSGRISPYLLSLQGRRISIDVGSDKSLKKTAPGEHIVLNEVGYWIDESRIMVRLADKNLERDELVLKLSRVNSEHLEGTLTIRDIKGVSVSDLSVICTTE